jgi:ubiquinone/menaquinone biosynthesis C-methylase UbiE
MTPAARLAATLAAYEHWAPHYSPSPHNPLMRAEQQAMLATLPDLRGRRVLDLACGTGRYSTLAAQGGATQVVAADFSPAMLARVSHSWRVRADLMHLPFTDSAFDVVVSGLALSHAGSLARCLREIARVLRPGGTLVYSDFHAAAASAGLTRSFRDSVNRRHVVPDSSLEVAAHRAALDQSGLVVESLQELRAGREVSDPFAGSAEFYRRWRDIPLVLVVRARR